MLIFYIQQFNNMLFYFILLLILKDASSNMEQKRYMFIVEQFDIQTSIFYQFNFAYYLPQNEIELYDSQKQIIYLKKTKYPQVSLKNLYIGSVFIFYNRQFKIIAYANQFTKKQIQNLFPKTYGMIKPNAYFNIGKIITATQQKFQITNIKMFKLTAHDAQQLYAQHKGKSFFTKLINFMISDFVVGMQLLAQNAIPKWRQLIGPTNSLVAKEKAPKSLRALYGIDGTINACHGSDSPSAALRQLNYIFTKNSSLKSQPVLKNSSLCIIKPHVVKNKNLGQIIDLILDANFHISALEMFWLDESTSKQFFNVYQYLPQYQKIIDQITSGPCIALQVIHQNSVIPFKQICGPIDPLIAKALRPKSIRALFGEDIVKNAVHCSESVEDGPLEVQYFFKTLVIK